MQVQTDSIAQSVPRRYGQPLEVEHWDSELRDMQDAELSKYSSDERNRGDAYMEILPLSQVRSETMQDVDLASQKGTEHRDVWMNVADGS